MQDANEMFNVELSFKRGMVNKGCFSREVIFQLKNNCLEGRGGRNSIPKSPEVGKSLIHSTAE